jgi:DNA polymerase-3 subunit alpha
VDDLIPPEDPPDWHLYGYDLAPEDDSAPVEEPVSPALIGTKTAPANDGIASPLPHIPEAPAPPGPTIGASFPDVALIVPPYAQMQTVNDVPRMVKITLRSTGDPKRDILRMKRVYNKLHSHPGNDRFAFWIFEGKAGYLFEFPNETTHVSGELLEELYAIVGRENVLVEPIPVH